MQNSNKKEGDSIEVTPTQHTLSKKISQAMNSASKKESVKDFSDFKEYFDDEPTAPTNNDNSNSEKEVSDKTAAKSKSSSTKKTTKNSTTSKTSTEKSPKTSTKATTKKSTKETAPKTTAKKTSKSSTEKSTTAKSAEKTTKTTTKKTTQTSAKKEGQLILNLEPEELARLQGLCDKLGMTIEDYAECCLLKIRPAGYLGCVSPELWQRLLYIKDRMQQFEKMLGFCSYELRHKLFTSEPIMKEWLRLHSRAICQINLLFKLIGLTIKTKRSKYLKEDIEDFEKRQDSFLGFDPEEELE